MTYRNNSRYSFGSTFYCTICHGDNADIKYIPVNQWCKENYYTRKQVYGLLRKRQLVGLSHKGRMYVATNPYYEGE